MTRDRGDGPLDVLLIEDNPGDIRLITDALEETSVESELTTVTNGEEALDYLSRRNGYDSATRPDLVLLDLNIPKVTGKAVLETVKADEDLRSTSIHVLSGSEAPDDVRGTYELGADGYFVKPVDPSDFISLVQTIEAAAASSGRTLRGKYAEIDCER